MNEHMLIGNCVEGYTPAELAAYQLRTDPVWCEQVAATNRLIAALEAEL